MCVSLFSVLLLWDSREPSTQRSDDELADNAGINALASEAKNGKGHWDRCTRSRETRTHMQPVRAMCACGDLCWLWDRNANHARTAAICLFSAQQVGTSRTAATERERINAAYVIRIFGLNDLFGFDIQTRTHIACRRMYSHGAQELSQPNTVHIHLIYDAHIFWDTEYCI